MNKTMCCPSPSPECGIVGPSHGCYHLGFHTYGPGCEDACEIQGMDAQRCTSVRPVQEANEILNENVLPNKES